MKCDLDQNNQAYFVAWQGNKPVRILATFPLYVQKFLRASKNRDSSWSAKALLSKYTVKAWAALMPLTKDSATVDPVCGFLEFYFYTSSQSLYCLLGHSRLMGAFALQLPSRFFDALRHFLTYKGNVASMRTGLLPCQGTK